MFSIVVELELHRIFALLLGIELFAHLLLDVFQLEWFVFRSGMPLRNWTQTVCLSHVSLAFRRDFNLALFNFVTVNFWVISDVETRLRELLVLVEFDATKPVKLVGFCSHRHLGSSIVYLIEALSRIQAVTIECTLISFVCVVLQAFWFALVQARLHSWQYLLIELPKVIHLLFLIVVIWTLWLFNSHLIGIYSVISMLGSWLFCLLDILAFFSLLWLLLSSNILVLLWAGFLAVSHVHDLLHVLVVAKLEILCLLVFFGGH